MATIDALYLRDTVRLTAGRIAWVANAIGKRLTPEERARLGDIVEEAGDTARRAYDLGVTRQRAKEGLFSTLAKTTNFELDHVTAGIFNQLDLLARIHGVGTEMGDRVRSLSATFYPHSLAAVTAGAFADELEAARRVVRIARGERAADVAAVPGLEALIDLLVERADAFEDVLEREQTAGPSFAEAEAAAAAAERRVVELVMAIQVLYQGDSPEAERRRSELLEPYAVQQASTRRRHRRRQRVVDVDPETGDEPLGPEEAADAADVTAVTPDPTFEPA